MRSSVFAAAVLAAFFYTVPAPAQVNIGVSIGGGDRDQFFLELGSYYRVPEREVVVVRNRHIREEEAPVVFYFAQVAHVRPSVIVDMREDGLTWMDIALHFRLSPVLFYDPVYGRPRGYDRWRPGRGWGAVRYSDDDFIRFANVRFLSERYHYRPENIMRMRDREHDYFMIHNDIRHEADHRAPGRNNQERMDKHDQSGKHDGVHDNGRGPDRNDNRNRHRPGRERE